MYQSELHGKVAYMVQKFQEAMSEFHDIQSKFLELSDSSKQLLNSNDSFSQELKDLSVKLDYMDRKLFNDSKESNAQSSILSNSLSGVSVRQDQMYSDYNKLMSDLSALRGDLKKLSLDQDSFAKKDELPMFVHRMNLLEKDAQDKDNLCKNQYVELLGLIKSLKDNCSCLCSKFDLLKADVDSLLSSRSNMNDSLEKYKLQCAESSKSYDVSMRKYIEDRIAAVPQPVIPSLDEAHKKMQDKLEPISLDARNSLLRSVNNESKISLLERKVEQLKLLLDKLQLQE